MNIFKSKHFLLISHERKKKLDSMDAVLHVSGLCNHRVLPYLLTERKVNEEDSWKATKISK